MVLEDGTHLECVIRWTPEELEAIKGIRHLEKGVSINILEFFVVMYAVILWGGKHLKGKVVQVNCDNTAAVSWILKQRGSNKAPIGEFLLQIFVLYSISIDSMIFSQHLAGVLNTHADYLSRSLSLQEISRVPVDTKEDGWWKELSREEVCRHLLSQAITMQSQKHSPPILNLLKSLL